MHPDRAHLEMRSALLPDFPAAPVVPGEAAAAQEGQRAHEGDDLAVHEHPEGVPMADGEKAEGDPDLSGHEVVAQQREPGVDTPRDGEGNQRQAEDTDESHLSTERSVDPRLWTEGTFAKAP